MTSSISIGKVATGFLTCESKFVLMSRQVVEFGFTRY